MAKYDKDTKFYWLLLKEDYAYFYLKLCLKSLKTNGILIRNVGNMLIPYDNKKLSEMTKMDFDTVTIAMELLKKIGLIKILDNGEIYLTQLENLIGSKSLGAFKKQQQRLLRGQEVDKCPPKIELELELKDKDRDKDIVISKTTTMYEYIENNFGRTLSSIEIEKIDDWLLSYDEEIIKYAIQISTLNNKRTFNYVNGILRNWKTAGYKTLQEIKDNELPKRRELSDKEKKELEEIFDYDWLNDDDAID